MRFILKLPSGTEKQKLTALDAANPHMVARDKTGKKVVRSNYTNYISMEVFDQLTVTPAVYSETEVDAEGFPIVLVPAVKDGPFAMVDFLDDQELPVVLPPGLTRKWENGGAPVKWAGVD